MGLELNLKDLSGKAIVVVERAIAKADKNGDNKIDFNNQEEVTIFAKEIKEQYEKGNLKMDEYIQLQRPIDTDKVQEAEPSKKEVRQAKREDKKDETRINNTFTRYMDELVQGGGTPDQVLDALDERFGSQKDNKEYLAFKTAVTEVLVALDTVTSLTVKDVDKNHNEVKEALEAVGKNDKLHRQILRDLEKMQKTEIRYEAFNDISAIYADIVAKDKEAGVEKRTDEAIMNDVKTQLEKDGKLSGATRATYNDAIDAYEKDKVMTEARKVMSEAIYGQIDSTKWRDVRSGAKKALQDSGVYDKYVEKAFKQNFGDAISGKKKLSRTTSENQARENNVAFKSIQSKDEILKALGKKSEVFEALISQGLITQREDGYYDMTKLQDILLVQVGADYKQARDIKEDRAISEKLRTLGKLSVDTKLNTLTEKEAKEVLKLCGFDIEKKDWGRVILQTILGGVVGGLAGGAIEATRPSQNKIVRPEDVIDSALDGNYEIKIPINNEIKIDGALKDFVTITQTGEVIIQLKDLVSAHPVLVQFMKQVPATALKSGLVGAALSFLNALGQDKAAIPVTVTQFQETDINDYITRLAKETPEYAPAFTALAKMFEDENGNWNVEEYKLFLDRTAGTGHKLERDELVGALKKLYQQPKTEKTEKTEQVEDNSKEETSTTPKTNVIADGESYEHKTKEVAIPTIDGRKTSWAKIAQSYECLVEKHGLGKAIRMVKIAQAITDGNYTEERLEELYNLSIKGASKLKNIEGIDYEKYYSVLTATYLSPYEYDKDGNVIEGTGVKVPVNLAGCKRDVEKNLTAPKAEGSDRVIAPKGHAADTVTEHYAIPVWGIKVNNGEIEVYYNKADSDKRFAELKTQYPDAKVEKLTREEINEAIKK